VSLRDAAIVAFAETKAMEKSDRDVWELGAEILEALLARSGFEKAEIDGLVMPGFGLTAAGESFWAQVTADQLGLELDYCDQVHIGGCSATGSVARAAAAIDAGLCTTALVLFADTGVAENNRGDRSFRREWADPYGSFGPPDFFGLLTRRYEHQHGLDYEILGKLAVTQRNHALLNDNACEKLRKPITIGDYLDSRMIADPIRLLDCVMRCDAASGLLVTSKRRAREKGVDKFVVPIGYGERTNFLGGENFVDVTRSGHEVCRKRALAKAGLAIKDVASFHPYDDFIIAIMLQLEAFGFCEPGQGVPYIRETSFAFDGDLPLNTGGGQISAGQAACCSHNLIEAVRQLMGEGGARQVKNTANALVSGIGWINYSRNWGSSSALVLVPDA
jgi:acetyl-CoA acetyltransferase